MKIGCGRKNKRGPRAARRRILLGGDLKPPVFQRDEKRRQAGEGRVRMADPVAGWAPSEGLTTYTVANPSLDARDAPAPPPPSQGSAPRRRGVRRLTGPGRTTFAALLQPPLAHPLVVA